MKVKKGTSKRLIILIQLMFAILITSWLRAFRAGEEFQVNTYIDLTQRNPDVAMDRKGNFVITWNSWEQDGSRNGVFAKMFKK